MVYRKGLPSINDLIKLYNSGLEIDQVAKKVGYKTRTIHRKFKKIKLHMVSSEIFFDSYTGELYRPKKKQKAFQSLEEVKEYLNHDELECLICGAKSEALYRHIDMLHKNITTREYKIMFGIPVTYGLTGRNHRKKLVKPDNGHRFKKGHHYINKKSKIVVESVKNEFIKISKKGRLNAADSLKKLHKKKSEYNCVICGAIVIRSDLSVKCSKKRKVKNTVLCSNCSTKEKKIYDQEYKRLKALGELIELGDILKGENEQ